MKLYDEARPGGVSRARQLRRNATDAEIALWRSLREAFPDARFRRQVPVGPYIADFLSFSVRLIIEADGGQHDATTDAARTRFLQGGGWRVLRFWNHDILQNMDGVIATIGAALAERRTSPSQPAAGPLPLPKERGEARNSPSPLGEGRGPRAAARGKDEALLIRPEGAGR